MHTLQQVKEFAPYWFFGGLLLWLMAGLGWGYLSRQTNQGLDFFVSSAIVVGAGCTALVLGLLLLWKALEVPGVVFGPLLAVTELFPILAIIPGFLLGVWRFEYERNCISKNKIEMTIR